MAPRLAHRKSRGGCVRCKARKVKCDESIPKCAACVRHGVYCTYPGTRGTNPLANGGSKDAYVSEQALELRLMHEWMAYVCESFSTTADFWRIQAPLIALGHRYLLDGLFALSALHMSRQGPKVWHPVEGRMVSMNDDIVSPQSTSEGTSKESAWKVMSRNESPIPTESNPGTPDPFVTHHAHMIHVAQTYFDRALDGQRRAITELNEDIIQAVYMCSVLVAIYGLMSLSEESQGSEELPFDAVKWVQIAAGSRHIASKWQQLVGERWYRLAGNFYGDPDLTDGQELFHPRHQEIFFYLLNSVDGDEMGIDDREVYEHTVRYIGVLYRGVVEKSEVPRTSCRRVLALPSRVPLPFAGFIEEQRPRALAILAHVFAIVKLVDEGLPAFKGIAERQMPILAAVLPSSWSAIMQWPIKVTEGATLEQLQEQGRRSGPALAWPTI